MKAIFSFFLKKYQPLRQVTLVLGGLIFLWGCESTRYDGTPVIQKHAKRGYNKPYTIKGEKYHPQPYYEYSEEGIASYYGGTDVFHGRATSTGEKFDMNGLTAAHKTLPIPSVVYVTNLNNGRRVKLLIIDRGPFVKGRIIDVSRKAADLLGFRQQGITKVRVESAVGESITLAERYHPKGCHVYKAHCGASSLIAQNTSQKTTHTSRIINPPRHPYLLKHGPNPKSSLIYQASKLFPRTTKGTYIQVGTYHSQQSAKNLAYRVSNQMRLPCKSYLVQKGNKNFYRVMLGPVREGRNTKSLLQNLKARGVKNAVIVVEK